MHAAHFFMKLNALEIFRNLNYSAHCKIKLRKKLFVQNSETFAVNHSKRFVLVIKLEGHFATINIEVRQVHCDEVLVNLPRFLLNLSANDFVFAGVGVKQSHDFALSLPAKIMHESAKYETRATGFTAFHLH